MRIDDGAEFVRRLQARQQRGRGARRHREHDGIVGRDGDGVVAEIQFADMIGGHRELAQLVTEPDGRALALQQFYGGLDQDRAQAVARDQGTAGLAARQQGLAHDRAGKPGRALGRIDIERGEQQRLHQPLVQRAVARDRAADQLVGACPNQRRQCEIVDQAGVGDAALFVEHPGRQPGGAEIECPTLAGRKIDEGKLRALGPDQARLGADRPGIVDRVAVARQQQMVAVIDREIGRGIEIGAAAAAGLLRRLVDMHAVIGIGEPDGRREAGNAGADNMYGFLHQMNA